MKRILVLGSSGSGKSTFARQLGKQLDLEVIHLDSHYWEPDWTNTSAEQWEQKLARLLAKERWIMDGNYPATLSQRLAYADTVIFLDLHRIVCLWRCIGRYLKYKGENRPELAVGCHEKIDRDFLKWIWQYPSEVKPRVLEAVKAQSGIQVKVLKGSQEIERFLENLGAT